MNKKKIYIVIGFVILLIFIISFSYLNFNKKDPSLPDVIKKDVQVENLSKPPAIKETIKTKKVSQTAPKALSVDKIKVSLGVLDKKYEVEIKENPSVFEVMKDLQNREENNFDFKYKEYPSLGIFIYEINGVKGTPGLYWIYYVNGKEASVGVSNYILK